MQAAKHPWKLRPICSQRWMHLLRLSAASSTRGRSKPFPSTAATISNWPTWFPAMHLRPTSIPPRKTRLLSRRRDRPAAAETSPSTAPTTTTTPSAVRWSTFPRMRCRNSRSPAIASRPVSAVPVRRSSTWSPSRDRIDLHGGAAIYERDKVAAGTARYLRSSRRHSLLRSIASSMPRTSAAPSVATRRGGSSPWKIASSSAPISLACATPRIRRINRVFCHRSVT